MKYTSKKLAALEEELKGIIKGVDAGKFTQLEAADKIIHIREEMNKVIEHLKTTAK